MIVGERIREARTVRGLSLSEVASKARISVATLSRVERGKQGLDLGLFLILTRILKTTPHDLISDDAAENIDPLAVRIGALNHSERMKLWRDLREQRSASKRNSRSVSDEVEELLAQLEYLRGEIEAVRAGARKR